MRTWIVVGLLGAALALATLAGCEQKIHSTKSDSPALPSVSVAPLPAPAEAPAPVVRAAPRPAPEIPGWAPPAAADTLVLLNGQPYHLLLEAETDSNRHLTATYEPTPGHLERVRGYEGRYTVTLRDRAGQQVFQRQLRKAAFFKRAGADIVTESEAYLPEFLGYSRPLGALVFTLDFMVPDSDVGAQVVLMLDLAGNVMRLSDGRGPGGGPECEPALSADGSVLLTASELLRPGRPPLRLTRLDAELVGASFLSDTTILVVYAPGKTHLIRSPDGMETFGRTPSPQQLRAPNAFVRHTRSGRVLSKFRYHGFYEELGYTIPGFRAHGVLYLLDAKRGLYLLPLGTPGKPTEMRFAAMPRFIPPQKPVEVRFEVQSEGNAFAFYVDTVSVAPRIRYQRLEN
ncbi:hypothetical protein [Hymenobacter terricola]|uniref:hypothetical protein n=1 Tax=Hymenobacter terricola TaxID=2819236 RepID=UPI001B302349|nr:hypothetical protein [Hymenobacter terricola]